MWLDVIPNLNSTRRAYQWYTKEVKPTSPTVLRGIKQQRPAETFLVAEALVPPRQLPRWHRTVATLKSSTRDQTDFQTVDAKEGPGEHSRLCISGIHRLFLYYIISVLGAGG